MGRHVRRSGRNGARSACRAVARAALDTTEVLLRRSRLAALRRDLRFARVLLDAGRTRSARTPRGRHRGASAPTHDRRDRQRDGPKDGASAERLVCARAVADVRALRHRAGADRGLGPRVARGPSDVAGARRRGRLRARLFSPRRGGARFEWAASVPLPREHSRQPPRARSAGASSIARQLDGELDERGFEHLAFYDEERQRIEMHLVSTRAQVLALQAADVRVTLSEGERVLTEISRKFTRDSIEWTLSLGGMRPLEWIAADDGAFALCLARTARGDGEQTSRAAHQPVRPARY